MKKIILIVLLFIFTSSVTAFAEVVEQCPAGPCSDGFKECMKPIVKSDDNGKTRYPEIVQGCCKESCGCPPESGQSQKQSPDTREDWVCPENCFVSYPLLHMPFPQKKSGCFAGSKIGIRKCLSQ